MGWEHILAKLEKDTLSLPLSGMWTHAAVPIASTWCSRPMKTAHIPLITGTYVPVAAVAQEQKSL